MSAFAMSAAVSDAARYQAIRDRDREADGTFYYAVETTGVFCKPSCASRLPRRENVRFFGSTAAAERAGFRACKRCKPTTPVAAHGDIVARVCAVIDASDSRLSLEVLARAVGMSPYHLHRVFKAATGLTPRAYAQARRRHRARTALRGRGTVTQAMYDAGFESSGRFYAEADASLGMTPKAFKGRGVGVAVRYAVARCTLGKVLVAAGNRGVCAIYLGGDEDKLVADLRESFANAVSVKKDDSLAAWVRSVVRHIDEGAVIDLPLELRGTVFQERVWNALRKIPAGTTMTYAELAKKIGKPRAVRAVGTACGRNEISVLVPCHRAVGSDGKMHGYRWGIDVKERLLALEGERKRK
ncbi:MAG: bifunctional DNA-binding transcriptional regulator/O6-methylguanine-DNA methyltransferase Ada [Myxococcota bacterium]